MSQVTTILSQAAETGAGSAYRVYKPDLQGAQESALVQVSGITNATVKIQGSLDGTNWADLQEVTSDEMVALTPAPRHVRANVTAYTSGTIDVQVQLPAGWSMRAE